MRVIHNASLIVLVIDVFRRQPIHNAVILCNGKQNPYIKKDDGYYIFCDLPPTSYEIEIFSPGYVKKIFCCNIEFGECKRFIFEMSFESDNKIISGVSRINFFIENKISNEKNVKIILKNPVDFMKLIKHAIRGDNEIALNVQDDNLLLFQNYIYKFSEKEREKLEKFKEESEKINDENADADDKSDSDEIDYEKELEEIDEISDDNPDEKTNQENLNDEKLFFMGYDLEYNAYILSAGITQDLPMGGKFLPFWELSIDKNDKVVLPIFSRFMDRHFLEFEIKLENKSRKVILDTTKIRKNNLLISKRVIFE